MLEGKLLLLFFFNFSILMLNAPYFLILLLFFFNFTYYFMYINRVLGVHTYEQKNPVHLIRRKQDSCMNISNTSQLPND